MDYAIDWAESALEDLKDLVRYIAADNPVAAERFGKAVIRRVEVLATFPRTGRIVPELGDDLLREVIWTPYRIVYEVDDSLRRVSVVRVWHGARGELEI
jgi:toxin ParE1/3/4